MLLGRHTLRESDVLLSFSLMALAAKLALVDGPLHYTELETFRSVFHISIPSQDPLDTLFYQAHHDPHDSTYYGRHLNRLYLEDDSTRQAVLFGLFQIAAADNPINEPEMLYLKKLAGILKINRKQFMSTLRFAMLPAYLHNPHDCLDISALDAKQDIRRKFHERIRLCHPDLLPTSLPEEIKQLLHEKCTLLTQAYHTLTSQAA